MLSQGRVKPNSASRTQQPSSASSAPPPPVSNASVGAAPSYAAPQRLLMEAKNTAAGMLRSSAPEPFAPPPPSPLVHSAPSSGGADYTTNPNHRASLPVHHNSVNNIAPHVNNNIARSSSSLAVAHQEFSSASGSGGFPTRHSAGLHAATSPGPGSGGNSSGGTTNTGRKGVAPQNARPVPVSHSAEPHAPSSTSALNSSSPNYATASSGPVLSNTARHQQQQIMRQQQLATTGTTTPPQQQHGGSSASSLSSPLVPQRGSSSGAGGPSVPTATTGRRSSDVNGSHQPTAGPTTTNHKRNMNSSDDGIRSSCNSSANSSENSPSSTPLAVPTGGGAGGKMRRTTEDVHHSTRVLMNVAAEFGGGGSNRTTPRHAGGNDPLNGVHFEDDDNGSSAMFATSDTEEQESTGHPSPAASSSAAKPHHAPQQQQQPQQATPALTSSSQRSNPSGDDSQRFMQQQQGKRTSSTPTPPPPPPSSGNNNNNNKNNKPSTTSGTTNGKSSGSAAASSSSSATGAASSSAAKPPQIDIGPACQSLSLYDAFSFDPVLKMWVVRDDVLSKCLEYIRIMGYQHPAYARALRTEPPLGSSVAGGAAPLARGGSSSALNVPNEKMKSSSIWCSSSTLPSPIVAANPQQAAASLLANKTVGGAGPTSGTTSPAVASPTVPAAAKLNDDRCPPLNNGPQWKLVPLKTSSLSSAPLKPTASQQTNSTTGDPSSTGEGGTETTKATTVVSPPPPPTTTTSVEEEPLQPLFFECEESLRWLAEQEYVIGTILLTCSFEPMSTTEKRAKLNLKKQQSSNVDASNNSESPPGKSSVPPNGQLIRRQYVPSHTHPIRYVAAHVIHNFSHWGDFKSFSAVWDAQVRLVLGVAQPSHQKTIPVPETGLVFSSEFECGNLARVQRHVQGAYNNPFAQSGVCPPGTSTNVYLLWIEGDTQSDKRLWFRFAVSGCKAREPLCLRMMNIAPNARLYRNGMKPVWRAGASQLQWTAVDDYTFHVINDDRDGELSFYIVPKSSHETIHVAFCVPYSYGDLLCHITQWHAIVKRSACNIRFEERVLCRTLDERKLHLLIITSQTEKIGGKQQHQQLDSRGRPIQQSGATPYSVFASGKKVILISGRVHPGEVTASHAVHGIVSFLLSHDPRAATLREHFIFFVVPMLNPDGVARGYSRLDQNGLNLNRCYNDPNPLTQPTVHSLRNVFDHLQTNFRDRFFMYLDFHSHASQQSGFAFGNHLPNSVQHWNMLFPRLVGIHSNDLFDFETCRFSRGHMVSKDGTSRVLFGGSLIHSYTVELTHFTDFKTFGDRHPTAPPAATMTAPTSSAATTTTASSVDKNGKPGAKKESERKDSVKDGSAPDGPAAAASPLLQSPVINSVLKNY
ncbi:zinc carboxypeptidase, putative [Bodo saltans]|uniref:Zinc carboxypeptidase, putative n=1 Tax=Bodo saltans TaxID=75058 RepID=A0A0S4IY62_BODSA|nr:zinc carboxypeptidase, putative [Bodo saltans]|eukprot:CUG08806.1 zinc carboxypeptidase, putative [Bodo saltans]